MDALYDWQETNKMKPNVRLSFKEYLELLAAVGKVAQSYARREETE